MGWRRRSRRGLADEDEAEDEGEGRAMTEGQSAHRKGESIPHRIHGPDEYDPRCMGCKIRKANKR